jgi:hypothetical protein
VILFMPTALPLACFYSSRTKGKAAKDESLTKFRCNAAPEKKPDLASNPEMKTVSFTASWGSWAQLIQKVYEVDPLIRQKCCHEIP